MRSRSVHEDHVALAALGRRVESLVVETQGMSAEQLVADVHGRFGDRVILASSFSLEDQVLVDMISKVAPDTVVLTLDTGRLPQETFDVIEQTRRRYGVRIEVWFPQTEALERMVSENGPNLFYELVELRRLCCQVRKIEPLRRALTGRDAWICGLRSGQSVTRSAVRRVDVDGQFGLVKVCPLADWSTDQVWGYIRRNEVPYNRLHDAGYPSIGCAPCTRAIGPGEDIRSGRWWWETPGHKECGLHLHADGSLGPVES